MNGHESAHVLSSVKRLQIRICIYRTANTEKNRSDILQCRNRKTIYPHI